ncbi:helix-turn-helix domain-containing protein [Streptomyces sp. NPDC051569]|uniref:helix-turn-helix domain-containing protein n=1 Tax=Streptomyces sp. NPDC051569 TaxID=3365661 RepID=UPI0037BD2982
MVGNHLAQHRRLSLTAIGLAVHIQSLADGAKVGIKALAEKFPEGEVVIAAALRELETYAYLSRERRPGPGGRWMTRTIAYDMPSDRRVEAGPGPVPGPVSVAVPVSVPASVAVAVPAPVAVSAVRPQSQPVPEVPVLPAEPVAVAVAAPPVPVPLPEPGHPDLSRHRTAAEILAGLRRGDERLVLSERDVVRLAPAVSAWLERGVGAAAVHRSLTAALPLDAIRHPAGFLGHRLTEMMPPPLPALAAAPPRAVRPDPLQNCDRCDRAFRAPEPGACRECRPGEGPGEGPDAGPDEGPDAGAGEGALYASGAA